MKHSPESQSNDDQVEPALHRSSEQQVTSQSPVLASLACLQLFLAVSHIMLLAQSLAIWKKIFTEINGEGKGEAKNTTDKGKLFRTPPHQLPFSSFPCPPRLLCRLQSQPVHNWLFHCWVIFCLRASINNCQSNSQNSHYPHPHKFPVASPIILEINEVHL